MYESNDKMVSHPKHYQSKNGLEVIDVIEAFTEGLRGIEAGMSVFGTVVSDALFVYAAKKEQIDHLKNESFNKELK